LEAERQECGSVSVGEESEVADAHEARRQQVEQEAAQELFDTKVMRLFLLPCAESLQRNVTLPSESATSLELEMATRWV